MSHLTNRRQKEIASLSRRKYRKELGQTLVEGRRAVASALDAGAPLTELIVADDVQHDPDVQSLVDRADVSVYVLSARDVERLSDVQTSQGVLAVVERVYVGTDELVDMLDETSTVLALDRVQDPGNVGTILRTAAWFGADVCVAGAGTAGLYGPKVMRAAAGGHWDVKLARTAELPDLLRHIQKAGVPLYGADLQGERAGRWTPQRPSGLVLGSEAHGLSEDVETLLDHTVAIPGSAHRRGTESLNVAIAAGILVYEWIGQP